MKQKTHTKSKDTIWLGSWNYPLFPEHHTPFDIFSTETNLNTLVKTYPFSTGYGKNDSWTK